MSEDIKNLPSASEPKLSIDIDDPRNARIPRTLRDVIKFEATTIKRRSWPTMSRCGAVRRAARRHC